MNLNTVIPAKAGIQFKHTTREADKTKTLPRFAGIASIIWIPAFAGMTF